MVSQIEIPYWGLYAITDVVFYVVEQKKGLKYVEIVVQMENVYLENLGYKIHCSKAFVKYIDILSKITARSAAKAEKKMLNIP